jgi:hypothetical protein
MGKAACGAMIFIRAKIGQKKKAAFFVEKAAFFESGGADRDQTDDLVVANDALYQLSYCPKKWANEWSGW